MTNQVFDKCFNFYQFIVQYSRYLLSTYQLNRPHFQILWQNRTFTIKAQYHFDYLKDKERELKALRKKLDPDAFIDAALRACRGCTFIVFTAGDFKKFVQFWLANGQYQAMWPYFHDTKPLHIKNEILGVLNEMGISQHPRIVGSWPWRQKLYYELIPGEKYDDYSIYFGNDRALATVFTVKVLTEVYDLDLAKIKCRIG